MLCGLAIALFWCAVYQAAVVAPIGAFCRAGEREISAVVTEYPTRSRYGSAVLIRAQDGKRSIPAVLYYQDEAELAPGDRIFCTAKIRAASPENLGRDEYYASRGVWMTASCRGKLTVTRGGFSVRYAPAHAAKTSHSLR